MEVVDVAGLADLVCERASGVPLDRVEAALAVIQEPALDADEMLG